MSEGEERREMTELEYELMQAIEYIKQQEEERKKRRRKRGGKP